MAVKWPRKLNYRGSGSQLDSAIRTSGLRRRRRHVAPGDWQSLPAVAPANQGVTPAHRIPSLLPPWRSKSKNGVFWRAQLQSVFGGQSWLKTTMFFVAKWALAIILWAITLASFDVGAQTLVRIYSHQSAGPAARFNGAAQITGKERLGEK